MAAAVEQVGHMVGVVLPRITVGNGSIATDHCRQWILQMKDDLEKNEMRLAAIEYLLCQLWVNSMKFGGVTEQEFAWRTDAMLANLKKQTFPGLDHLAAGQLEEAVGHLVDIQREMLGFQKVQKV